MIIKQWIFGRLRHLFTSKIADNYICIFTPLSYLNNPSLHQNVSSYLLVAYLELEIACISQSFLFILKQILVNKCCKQVDIKSLECKGNMTLKFCQSYAPSVVGRAVSKNDVTFCFYFMHIQVSFYLEYFSKVLSNSLTNNVRHSILPLLMFYL